MFDPVQPSWTAGLLALLYAVTRIVERRAKRLTPGGVQELRERAEAAHERLDVIDQRLESLVRSNNHRKAELAEISYNLKRLTQRLDEASDSG